MYAHTVLSIGRALIVSLKRCGFSCSQDVLLARLMLWKLSTLTCWVRVLQEVKYPRPRQWPRGPAWHTLSRLRISAGADLAETRELLCRGRGCRETAKGDVARRVHAYKTRRRMKGKKVSDKQP